MPSENVVAEKVDKVVKTFTGEVKAVNEDEHTIDMLIPMNTDSVDRDGEIVEPKGARKTLKDFMKRPILVSSHNYFDLRKQIGQFVKLTITDDGLMAEGIKYYAGEGNQEADWAFNLASKGMAAFSIGFIPTKWEKIDEEKDSEYQNRRYTEWELLEISQVVVPSNRDAIQGVRAKAAAANDEVVTSMMDKMVAALDSKGLVEEIVKAEVEDKTDEPGEEETENKPKEYTQGQLADDMDFLLENLQKVGMGEEATERAKALATEIIQRLPGSDIPDEIKAKVGLGLEDNNIERLTAIQQLAQDVMDNAKAPDTEKQPDAETPAKRLCRDDMVEIGKVVVSLLKGKRIPK